MYSFPGAEFQSIITRTSQPVRALAFSPSGGTLAVAGDDGNIKVVDTAANKVKAASSAALAMFQALMHRLATCSCA